MGGSGHRNIALSAGAVAAESARPLQDLADGLLEHGLVADAGLFGDPLRLFEIGGRDAD
jgi:hypothetical protein